MQITYTVKITIDSSLEELSDDINEHLDYGYELLDDILHLHNDIEWHVESASQNGNFIKECINKAW